MGVRTLQLFGKEVPVRVYGCSKNRLGCVNAMYGDVFNLSLQIGNGCNADCKFCIFHEKKSRLDFDTAKLLRALDEVYKVSHLHKLNLTGAEPTLFFDKFQDIFWEVINRVDELSELKGVPKPYVTLNTNGLHLSDLTDEMIDRLDSVALSRHHYVDSLNREVFGTQGVPDAQQIAEFCKRDTRGVLHIRCNILKGYIDSVEEVKEFLSRTAKLGVIDFGFVSLMGLNGYCREHFVDFMSLLSSWEQSEDKPYKQFSNVRINLDTQVLEQDREAVSICSGYRKEELSNHVLQSLDVKQICSCANYNYFTGGMDMVKFYCRTNEDCSIQYSSFVYDGSNLRLGFGGEVIY